MTDGNLCRCGHAWFDHRHDRTAKPCCYLIQTGPLWSDWRLCSCAGWNDSYLPAPGERLEFGKHHLSSVDAEAEAWPVKEGQIERTIRRAAGLDR